MFRGTAAPQCGPDEADPPVSSWPIRSVRGGQPSRPPLTQLPAGGGPRAAASALHGAAGCVALNAAGIDSIADLERNLLAAQLSVGDRRGAERSGQHLEILMERQR